MKITPQIYMRQDDLWLRFVTVALWITLILTSCQFPGSTKPVIKIGLVAPFEGIERHNGYQRLYGVKLALREVNQAGGVAGYKIALIALNDYADPTESALQAKELVLDSDVRGIIGQWQPRLFEASLPVYQAAHIAVMSPAQITMTDQLPEDFVSNFKSLWASQPDLQAQQAYLATIRLIEAIKVAVEMAGSPERVYILQALHASVAIDEDKDTE